MYALIGLNGFIGLIVCLILLLIASIRKKPKKEIVVLMSMFFLFFVVGIMMTPTRQTEDKTTKNQEQSLTPSERVEKAEAELEAIKAAEEAEAEQKRLQKEAEEAAKAAEREAAEKEALAKENRKITMEEFNNIEMGMTYEQIRDIVGGDGEITLQSETAGFSMVVVYWYGEGLMANANVTFMNGVATAKAQLGLQ